MTHPPRITPNPEPLSSLYRRVVEAVPEARVRCAKGRRDVGWIEVTTDGAFMAPSSHFFCIEPLIGWHWQRLCDERGIYIQCTPTGCSYMHKTDPEAGWQAGFDTRLHALGEALIAHANRGKAHA